MSAAACSAKPKAGAKRQTGRPSCASGVVIPQTLTPNWQGACAVPDAFDLRRMQAVDLAPALLPTALFQHAGGRIERPPEDPPKVVPIRICLRTLNRKHPIGSG